MLDSGDADGADVGARENQAAEAGGVGRGSVRSNGASQGVAKENDMEPRVLLLGILRRNKNRKTERKRV